MIAEPILFGSDAYLVFLGLLIFARGMDFLSTWVATPNLVLEANPVARKIGWRWGIPLNLALCLAFAMWPLPAIMTTNGFQPTRTMAPGASRDIQPCATW